MESEDTEALGVARLRQDEHVYRCRLKVSMEVHKMNIARQRIPDTRRDDKESTPDNGCTIVWTPSVMDDTFQ